MYLTLEWNWFPAEQHVCFCLRLRNPKWKSCSDIHFIHFRWWQTVAAASSPHPSAPSQQLFNDKTVVLMLKVGTLVFPHRKLIRNQYGNRSGIGLISRIWTWEILKGATTMNKVRLVCVCEGEYRSRGVVIIKTLGAAHITESRVLSFTSGWMNSPCDGNTRHRSSAHKDRWWKIIWKVTSLTQQGTPAGTWGSSAGLLLLLLLHLLWRSSAPPLPRYFHLACQTPSPGWWESVCCLVQSLSLSSPLLPLHLTVLLLPPICRGKAVVF